MNLVQPTYTRTDPTMKQSISIFMLAAIIAGCGSPLSHCEPSSALNPHISDAQQSECDDKTCEWNPDAPECAGETGEPEETKLLCANSYGLDYCWDSSTTDSTIPGGGILVAAADCQESAPPFPHVQSFLNNVHEYSGRLSQWCAPDGLRGPAASLRWNLCHRGDGGASYYEAGKQYLYPAVRGENWNDQYGEGLNEAWTQVATCSEPTDSQIGVCNLGLVAVGSDHPGRPGEWTCQCMDDQDCPGGTVCEAGYYLDGFYPAPSLCTWDGAFEQGPPVYGLKLWDEGVTVEGHNVTMTTAMFVAAVNGAGLWNDDQMIEPIDETGLAWELTECGPDGMCAHLGFETGDEFYIEVGEALAIYGGVGGVFTVLHDGDPQTWALSMS